MFINPFNSNKNHSIALNVFYQTSVESKSIQTDFQLSNYDQPTKLVASNSVFIRLRPNASPYHN